MASQRLPTHPQVPTWLLSSLVTRLGRVESLTTVWSSTCSAIS